MSAEVLSFPSPPELLARAGALRAGPPPRRRIYSFADVVRFLALDLDGTTPRTQVEYLRRLHDQAGMPAPLNPRWRNGKLQKGAAAIGRRSRWCALEWDGWAESHRSPPPAGMAADVPPLPRRARDDCAERARMLGAG